MVPRKPGNQVGVKRVQLACGRFMAWVRAGSGEDRLGRDQNLTSNWIPTSSTRALLRRTGSSPGFASGV